MWARALPTADVELLGLDGRDDGALAHAIAATDLGIVRHGGEIGRRGLPATGLRESAAEHQPFAQGADIFPVAHHLQVPLAVGDITIEHRAHQPAVAQHDLLVKPLGIVAQGDFVIGFVGCH